MNKKNIVFLSLSAIIFLTFVVLGIVKVVSRESEIADATPKMIYKNSTIKDVDFEDERLHIYVFWGEGCPHCKAEFEFLETLQDEYADKIVVYGFEVWNNEENNELLSKASIKLGKEASKIPYTIINDKHVSGYSTDKQEKILELINNTENKKYDVLRELEKES